MSAPGRDIYKWEVVLGVSDGSTHKLDAFSYWSPGQPETEEAIERSVAAEFNVFIGKKAGLQAVTSSATLAE